MNMRYEFFLCDSKVELTLLRKSSMRSMATLAAFELSSLCTWYERVRLTIYHQRYAVEYGGHVLLYDLED